MNYKAFFITLLLASSCLLSGCNSGNTSGSIPTTQLSAHYSPGGVTTAWPYATFYGSALQPSCSDATDANCRLSLHNPADVNGNYALQSDAIPGEWQIGVVADNYCVGRGTGGMGQLSAGGVAQFYCGTQGQGFIVFSPSKCTIQSNQATGDVTSDCPSSITGTTPSVAFPTAYPMAVGGYDNGANSLSSANITATDSQTIVVPTPTQTGYTVFVVRDPNTNEIVGAGQFQVIKQIIHCTPRTC